MLHGRTATTSINMLYIMKITDISNCEYCNEEENNIHAIMLYSGSVELRNHITILLSRLGYQYFILK